MKINWKVRVKNQYFWVQILLAIAVPVLGYFGLSASDLTTWTTVFETVGKAFLNPYVIGMMVVSAYNAVIDPTTVGISDSDRAMTYTKPYAGGESK